MQLLKRLDHFTDWWLRVDLFEQTHHFLADLQDLLAAQACFLYLADPTSALLALAARSEQAEAAGPAQLPLGSEEFWPVVREHWTNRQFAEVNAICQQMFVLALGKQAMTAAFAPLFAPRVSTPPGLLMIYPKHAWRQEDNFLLRQISIPLALRLAEQRTHDQLEQSHLITAFVRLLCTTPLDPIQEETVRRQARLLGVDLAHPHLVALAQLATSQHGSVGMPQVMGQLQARMLQQFPGALLLLQESAEIFCLLPLAGSGEQAIAQLKQMVRDLHPSMHLLLGVSNPARSLQEYARSSIEARDALAYAQHFHQGGVFHIQDVGPLRFLKLEDARASRATDRYSQAIQKLAAYDQQYHADLLYTLEKFLLAGGRYSQAARMMESEPGKAIAVGTVRQRVERMCEITDLDLLDSTLWLHLQLAIQVHHIQET
jgi:sugar diacid utilization regulator